MLRSALAFVAGVMVGAVFVVALVTAGGATSDAGSTPGTYPAVVRCDGMAEDSAAHVVLVRYGHGGEPLVYRCERSGY